ncbi:hypothetical protein KTAU_04420 [Thermogemmatispora aurantia]|uniref:Uncharacterized protein n=2 Tax=Thermogemmatispora aurantia TaxID=2045279 RepID=A0A5J4JWG1_9CHLR|nr:hypothetical protein KTAU_04420 [Thermogemmatispora aurantia]
MAVFCPHCGKALPRENARFCNNCGRFLPATKQVTPSTSVSGEPPSAGHLVTQEPAGKAPAPNDVHLPPPWLDQLDREVASRRWRAPRRDSFERLPDLPGETESPFQSAAAASSTADSPDQGSATSWSAQPAAPRPASPSGEQESSAAEDMGEQSETAAVAEAWRRAWLADAPTSTVPAARSEETLTEEAGQLLPSSSEGELRSGRSLSPRELHVRIWEENETLIMPQPGEASEAEIRQFPGQTPIEESWSQAQVESASLPLSYEDMPTQGHLLGIELPRSERVRPGEQPDQRHEAVGDLPTMPLKASPGPGLVIERASTPRPSRWQEHEQGKERGMSFAGQASSLPRSGDIEELDTMRLAAQPPVGPGVTAGPWRSQPVTPLPASALASSSGSPPSLPGISEAPLFGAPATRTGAGTSSSRPPEVASWGADKVEQASRLANPSLRQWEAEETAALPQVEKPSLSPAARSTTTESRTSRRRKRPLAVVALILALLLIGGGLTAWVVVYQPFSVPLITQPLQAFSDQRLGVALSYPQGWSYQLDYQQGKVTFSDSSQTGQMILLVAPAGDQDPAHYLQKEASQVGLTGAKAADPLTFGGVSWQQLRGTVTIAGASYTEVLLVTSRSGHLYTFMQLAYQKIYTDEEKQVFAPVRASFRFLS